MKLIIAGSRDLTISVEELDVLIKNHFDNITEVVSGCAKGIDSVGINWAIKNNISVKKFVPNWKIGRAAGIIRNKDMGEYADCAIVIYNGSSGSQHIIDFMHKLGKMCIVVKI